MYRKYLYEIIYANSRLNGETMRDITSENLNKTISSMQKSFKYTKIKLIKKVK